MWKEREKRGGILPRENVLIRCFSTSEIGNPVREREREREGLGSERRREVKKKRLQKGS